MPGIGYTDFDEISWEKVEESLNIEPKDRVIHVNAKYSKGSKFGDYNIFYGCFLLGEAVVGNYSHFIHRNVIGAKSKIGERSEIEPYSQIGAGSKIGYRGKIGRVSRIGERSVIGAATSFETPVHWHNGLSFEGEICLDGLRARAEWSGNGYKITPIDEDLKVQARKIAEGLFVIERV